MSTDDADIESLQNCISQREKEEEELRKLGMEMRYSIGGRSYKFPTYKEIRRYLTEEEFARSDFSYPPEPEL